MYPTRGCGKSTDKYPHSCGKKGIDLWIEWGYEIEPCPQLYLCAGVEDGESYFGGAAFLVARGESV